MHTFYSNGKSLHSLPDWERGRHKEALPGGYRMLEKKLSSPGTLAYKIVLPVLCLSVLTAWMLAMLFGEGRVPPFLCVGVALGICLLSVALYCPLKYVKAGEAGLTVGNYISKVEIPYENVAEVRELKWLNVRPITIILKQPCKFGRKIRFMPRGQFLILLWKDHPVAVWLRRRCNLAEV